MNERIGVVTLLGNPVTLVGKAMEVGAQAPEFTAVANDLSTFTFSSTRGGVCILLTVPSLDTPVCDLEVRRFNEEAAKLGGGVKVVVVSMDLPFAQSRWCGAAEAKQVQTVSDHREAAAGLAYGVLIKEARLLARAAFVVDPQGKIAYAQIVAEVADEPDYSGILAAARKLI